MLDVRLLMEGIDPESMTTALAESSDDIGGIATFVGRVRGSEDVEALELLHYEPLTLPGMKELGHSAIERFDLAGLVMLHRIGLIGPGEPIVCVSAAARHRRSAILATDYCMDHLKSAAWFWKREQRAGKWRWIEPRPQDHRDLARWHD
ncbi:MAG: molybdenum cofactor biosynthesis protein MoaE [Pseudomonadota bacterium]